MNLGKFVKDLKVSAVSTNVSKDDRNVLSDSSRIAAAMALAIENGQVRLTVEVDASTDLKNWKPAKTVEISVPVEGEKGFYILKSE